MKYSNSIIPTVIILLALMLTQAPLLIAQHGPRGKEGQSLDKMKAALQLSEQQTVQIEAIFDEYSKKMAALRLGEESEHGTNRAQMHSLMEEQRNAIASILTTEQKEKMEAARKERRENRHQRHQAHEDRLNKVDRKALKTALDNYKADNIQPVMLAQRAKLEQSISAVDKIKIEALRLKFADQKKEMTARMKAFEKKEKGPERGKKRRPHPPSDEMEEKMKLHKASLEELKILVGNYDQEISALLTEIKPQQQQWHTDMKQIKQKYFKDEKPLQPEARNWEGKAKKHRIQKDGAFRHPHVMHKGHFLLLDPEEGVSPSPTAAYTNIKVYPSPSSTYNNIEFEVKEPGRIKIEIIDNQGKLIREISDEVRAAGLHTLDIDLSDLKGMVFYYRITDKNGIVSSKKFIITRD